MNPKKKCKQCGADTELIPIKKTFQRSNYSNQIVENSFDQEKLSYLFACTKCVYADGEYRSEKL